jgi:hypothetical protein
MKKIAHRMFSLVSALVMTITIFSSALAFHTPAQAALIHKNLSVTDSTGLSFETSGAMEKVTTAANGWTMQAGGDVASTHYARAKYKLPETAGVVFTYFYAKAVIVLPVDFYTQQKAGFRILNTDNYPTTLNGSLVGASNANELRVSIYMNSDQKLRVLVDHETGTKLTLYTAPAILPTGEHIFELAGDVANAAPWYLKIDGAVVASGTQRLSTDDMLDSERVLTRIVAGIDGAADQDNNSMNLLVKSLEIANYDVSNVATSVPPTASPTASLLPPLATATSIVVPTTTPQSTNTLVVPTGTTNSVDVRVSSGSDDVEENSSGKVYIDSTDLELIYDVNAQVIGIRFTGVKIPKQSVITNAYIQFKVDEISSKKIKLIISGETSANALAFANNARNVSMRTKTSNKVIWLPSTWLKVGETRSSQRTPNLKSIVQEIINQSNWNSGNSLVLIIAGSSGKRVAESFEGDSAGAPLLHVEFSMPTESALGSSAARFATTATLLIPPTTIPPTFTPEPTQVVSSPTATEIILPTDTPVPTLVPSSPTVEVVIPTETPIPAAP